MRAGLMIAAALAAALPGCKPPPTDAAVARVSLLASRAAPSQPLASPDTTAAVWSATANPLRLVYGIPGQPVLLALECLEPARTDARIRITRHAPADSGAAALLALVGHDNIGRFPVTAAQAGGRMVWQGEIPAAAPQWEALSPAHEATATVPGAGLVRLNPSPLPLITACRGVPTETPPSAISPLS